MGPYARSFPHFFRVKEMGPSGASPRPQAKSPPVPIGSGGHMGPPLRRDKGLSFTISRLTAGFFK